MRITVYGYQDKFSGKITKYNLQLIKSFDGGCALKMEVERPDYLKPEWTEYGDILINDKGSTYLILLDKLLRVHNKSYTPVILLPNTDMMTRGNGYLALKVYSEEWVSCAFSIEEYLGNKDN